MEKKLKISRKIYCQIFLSLFIVAGCASAEKKTQIMSLQKQRIVHLEQQLKIKNRQIDKLKANRWINKPTGSEKRQSFKKLDSLMEQARWVQALQLSHKLKKSYPRSLKLSKARYKIFKNMGLKKQAAQEIRQVRKRQAQRSQKRKRQ